MPVTQALLVANVLFYLLMMGSGLPLLEWFALWPLGPLFEPWQLVSYSFLHGGVAHIVFNMFALYTFGAGIERLFGSRFYALYYFACVVSAAICHLVFTSVAGGPPVPTVGASGGVYGLLLAYGLYFPHQPRDAADPADPDERAHAGVRVRRAGAVLRRHRHRRRHRALRAPRRHARRLADDRIPKKSGRKTMKVVALEEHYWDAEVASHFKEQGPETRNPKMLERLTDLGALRLKEMDDAGIDLQVLSHGAPATQRIEGELAVSVSRNANDRLHKVVQGESEAIPGVRRPADPTSRKRRPTSSSVP